MTFVRRPVVFVLAVVALAALFSTGMLSHAPNRLISGDPLGLVAAFGPGGAVALVALDVAILIMTLRAARRIDGVIAALAALGIVLLLFLAGDAASRLAADAPPAARTSFGAGFWIVGLSLGFILRQTLKDMPRMLRAALPLGLAAALLALAASGALDQLSLAKEYQARRGEFADALFRHALIAVLGLVPAIALGSALGLLAHRHAQSRGPIFAVLDTVQVIPAVAVFALLMTPFAALAGRFPSLREIGFGGIGTAPAVLALLLYLLLPLARSVQAGLASVDGAVIEAARGMGLSRRRILWDVEAPLALPAFLAGLRIAVVQSIGLTTLAALVGGGGLGGFIFQGMGQFALDLVLLGVLPIAVLTALADALLRFIERASMGNTS